MHFAIIFHIKTGTGLQVSQFLWIGQIDTKDITCPSKLLVFGHHQIDPDRINADQILIRLDRNLPQAPFMKIKHPNDRTPTPGPDLNNQFCTNRTRYLTTNILFSLILDQLPNDLPVISGQSLQDTGDRLKIQLIQQSLKLHPVLFVHQVLNQIMARHVLSTHQVFHQFMTGQQSYNISQIILNVFVIVHLFCFLCAVIHKTTPCIDPTCTNMADILLMIITK